MMARPFGSRQTPETRAKIREGMRKVWDAPEYRERATALLRLYAVRRRVKPPKGTERRRLYDKIQDILGAQAAREALGIGQ